VTAGFENIFMGHNSWFQYAATMRIFKHYYFPVNDPDTAAISLSFSSYAGSVIICVTSTLTCEDFCTVVMSE